MKIFFLMGLLFCIQICNACTGFGIVTQSGTIIGRNRDYFYSPQHFEKMMPIQQFNNWYENNYHHDNQFYALTSKNNVSMGINQNGLTIIEEDSPLPQDAKNNRRFQQPENGTAEGMIKYGILQNFNTVDEIIPFLSKIFSVADPHFYQIADDKKFLIVEVAYGQSNADLKRQFTYQLITKPNDYFAHTNFYLGQEFASLNHLRGNQDFLNGAKNRLQEMTDLISQSKTINMDTAINWLRDTHSKRSNQNDKDWCQDTSLFRSNLQGLKSVDTSIGNNKIYGTMSSMVVFNTGNLNNSYIYLMMIDSIVTDNHNRQLIKYKELRSSVAQLFSDAKPLLVEHEFIRNPPSNGICN